MVDLIPVSGLLAAWGNSYLRGAVGPDDAVDGLVSSQPALVQRVDFGDEHAIGWSLALGQLRALGADHIGLRLPASGDVAGLPGPADFNRRALASGECVVIGGTVPRGAIPTVEVDAVRWEVCVVDRIVPVDDLSQVRRLLAQEMADRTAELTRLDLARGRDAADSALRRAEIGLSLLRLPPSHPQRAVDLIGTATRVLAVVEVARTDDGAAVTAAEAAARVGALLPLERAARAALAAAYSAR